MGQLLASQTRPLPGPHQHREQSLLQVARTPLESPMVWSMLKQNGSHLYWVAKNTDVSISNFLRISVWVVWSTHSHTAFYQFMACIALH